MLKIVTDDASRDDLTLMLDELVAVGALRMLMAGLETEVADHIERHRHLVDAAGIGWWYATGKRRNGPW